MYERGTCIIDLPSFHSLRTLISCIDRHRNVSRFIFIGNDGVYSRLLLPLISLESDISIKSYCNIIRHCPGVTYDAAINFLLEYKSLENFTHIDKSTIRSLLLNDTMADSAKYIGTTPKIFYHRVDKLVKKLHMHNRLQAHWFFRHEFHPDYVQLKIDEHVRRSVRQQLGNMHDFSLALR